MYCRQQNLSVSACVSTLISTEERVNMEDEGLESRVTVY